MKKILSFFLALVLICSAVAVSAASEPKNCSQQTLKLLAEHKGTDSLYVTIEVYTGVKTMAKWEFFWRNGIDMSRFASDKKYSEESYEKYLQYYSEIDSQKTKIMEDFFYNEFGASKETQPVFNGYLGVIVLSLPVSEITRLKDYPQVLGFFIHTPGYDAPFGGDDLRFVTEVYNTEYLGNTESEKVSVEWYGADESYALFRSGLKSSDEKSEEIIDDFLIIGSEYTHSKDNPTGLFITSESSVVRTLKEGFQLNLLHMDKVAMELPYVYVIGDADYDLKITVKDASAIQKLLAGLEEYKEVTCVSRPEDKDRDGKVTIKDASAIQKYIARIDPTASNVG